jgi:hypothetical protein
LNACLPRKPAGAASQGGIAAPRIDAASQRKQTGIAFRLSLVSRGASNK